MNAEERREQIRQTLTGSDNPVSASHLAADFGVSRQIIVGDIALLRAAGANILATPRGYMLEGSRGAVRIRVACRHDAEGMRDELNIFVDEGCTVLDVSVEHPVYGELTGSLMLKSRHDVEEFLEKSRSAQAMPLSVLTEGVHLHTVEAPDAETVERTKKRLQEAGFLLN